MSPTAVGDVAVAAPAPPDPAPAASGRGGRSADPRVPAGVAAGHPVTAEVGLRVLATGGSAADAAVAAMLAACVAESVLTGIGGGGFATYFDASSRGVTALDFFCTVPGLDCDREPGPMRPVDVCFGDMVMDYAIGAASVAVPGVPAGAGAVHQRWGRLPWHRVVQPAIGLARSGVILPTAQAHTLNSIHPALTPGDGAEIYSPGGRLLRGGDLLYHPGLDLALTALAEEGPGEFYTGRIASMLVDTVRAGGGALGPADLAGYRVLQVDPTEASFAGRRVIGRDDLNGTIATLRALPDEFPALPRPRRACVLADAMRQHGRQRLGDTTNICVVDDDANACVITLTLGLGSGVWLPGLGVHLNSMLGEGELRTGPAAPGDRMRSMMCPLVAVDAGGDLEIAAGAAGASRIRTALLHTLAGAVADGQPVDRAIAAPRFHVVDNVVHAEPGYPEAELDALSEHGYKINMWDGLDSYFGAASAVGARSAGGDPRRGGVGLLLRS